eukprot:1148390-Pelagomonas_calceolata.AAC.2
MLSTPDPSLDYRPQPMLHAHLGPTHPPDRPSLCANDQQRLSCAPFFPAALQARGSQASKGKAGMTTALTEAAATIAAAAIAAAAGHTSMRVTRRTESALGVRDARTEGLSKPESLER